MAETRRRGFAAMDTNKQKQIARKGGKAAHEKGTAHEFTPDEARAAGRKGGAAVSRDRAHMAAIGKKGGERRSRARREAQTTPQPGQQAQVAPAPAEERPAEATPAEERPVETSRGEDRAAG